MLEADTEEDDSADENEPSWKILKKMGSRLLETCPNQVILLMEKKHLKLLKRSM